METSPTDEILDMLKQSEIDLNINQSILLMSQIVLKSLQEYQLGDRDKMPNEEIEGLHILVDCRLG